DAETSAGGRVLLPGVEEDIDSVLQDVDLRCAAARWGGFTHAAGEVEHQRQIYRLHRRAPLGDRRIRPLLELDPVAAAIAIGIAVPPVVSVRVLRVQAVPLFPVSRQSTA